MENKLLRLDGEYAAEWTYYGLKIFPYFIDDEIIRQDLGPGSVILGETAQAEIVNAICSSTTRDLCNRHNDLAAERDAVRGVLITVRNRLRNTTQTLSNIVSSAVLLQDTRAVLENEWTNVLATLTAINVILGNDDA